MGNNGSITEEGKDNKLHLDPERPLGSEDAFVIFKGYLSESEDRLDRENAKRFLQDLAEAIGIEYNADQADKLFDECTSPDDRFLSFPNFKKMIWRAHEEIEKATLSSSDSSASSPSLPPSASSSKLPEKDPKKKVARSTSPFRGRGERGEKGHDKGRVGSERGHDKESLRLGKRDHKARLSQGWDKTPAHRQRHRFNISPSMLGDPFEKTKIFGVPVEIAASRNPQNRLVPLPLVQAFDYIETAMIGKYMAIEEEGLYRVPGSHQAFVQYRLDYDMGLEVDFSKEQNVENVALVVIKYFKGLPKSILSPYEREFGACQKAAGGDPLELIRTLPQLLDLLSDSSVETLRALVHHLQEVIKHAEKNKMTLQNVERTFAICLGPTFGWLVGVLVENDMLPDERTYKGGEGEGEGEGRGGGGGGWASTTPGGRGRGSIPSPVIFCGRGSDGSGANTSPPKLHRGPSPSPPSPSHIPLSEGPSSLSNDSPSSHSSLASSSSPSSSSSSFSPSSSLAGGQENEGEERREINKRLSLRKSGSGFLPLTNRRSKHYQSTKADEKKNNWAYTGKKTRGGFDPSTSRTKGQPETEKPSSWIANQPIKTTPTFQSNFPYTGQLELLKPFRLWYSMYAGGRYVFELDSPESVFELFYIEVKVSAVYVEWENLHAERLTSSCPRLHLEFRVQPTEEGEEEEYRGLVIEATLKPLSKDVSLSEKKINCRGSLSIYANEKSAPEKDTTVLPVLYDDNFNVLFPIKNNLKFNEITECLEEEKKRITQLLQIEEDGN